jgi:hypothetical protein
MSRVTLKPTCPDVQWVLEDVFWAVKQKRHEADHSPPSSPKVKNGGAIPLFPHMFSWHYLHYSLKISVEVS